MKVVKREQVNEYLTGFDRLSFQKNLIEWFETEKRNLPWRLDNDPYKVWVSEIMLQQTKVDTVIPYFNRFIKKFPTVEALAEAEEQEVLKAWEGLGYYSRARNLQTAVKEVVANYGSRVPKDPNTLSSLKGVGPYTKGAILSIAYDVPEPAVDGNVMRVMSRVLKIDEDIAKQKTRKLFESCIKEVISQANPSSFNQGLMELGALICTPKSPSCSLCPVQEHCAAYQQGMVEQLPVKSKNKKQKTLTYFAFVIHDKSNVLIEQRPEQGLLANLWQFPMVELSKTDLEHTQNWIKQNYGLTVKLGNELSSIKHVFSHLIWDIRVFQMEVIDGAVKEPNAKMVAKERLNQYPFPVSHQKIIQQF
ncbi:A/G-specific adenine glycosylase [Aquibacillus albus]|uniref:Adenine DNA glycosylase n=1 Tax=Aquibacillus albus TaxID=1168171 RepID=A0ABS2N337_9BACI|nr:A/G-specific adenine glycosylase [Aquibacillus albus]